MIQDIHSIEKEARILLDKQEYQQASKLFAHAAELYTKNKQHKEAALCFASAASCWQIKAGEQMLTYRAATLYEKAAKEAQVSGNFEFASTFYKQAGMSYERDLEYTAFSECFFRSKECFRKHLGRLLLPSKKTQAKYYFKDWLKNFVSWSSLSFSSLLWGHGERPQRTIIFACFIILAGALCYTQGYFIKDGAGYKANFPEALYFSMTTLTTFIWYSDLIPQGVSRVIATFEGLCGIFIIPVFITGLCRKYLRFL